MRRVIFEFDIPGKAVPQARPRFAVRGGRTMAYEPKRCSEYKQLVRRCAFEQCVITPENAAYAGALSIKVIEYRGIPKSWSKDRQEAARLGLIKAVGRPDADNVLKCIQDALTGVLWVDDAQSIHSSITKVYAADARVNVRVQYFDCADI